MEAMPAEPAAPATKPLVYFIDDDLALPRFASLTETLRKELSDINSPDLATLWELGRGTLGLPELGTTPPGEVLARVQQEDFVRGVVLSDGAYGKVSEDSRRELDSVRAHRESIVVFADSVRKAFPTEGFELTEFSERPADRKSLLKADLLILDLVMGGGDPIAGVKAFLQEIAKEAGDGAIPPILLVSLHDDALKKNHLDIRSSAHISASGLFVLSKKDVAEPTGHFMLSALWAQLTDRRKAATKMRALFKAVESAFEGVKQHTMQTLWSLDVASMHQIYVTARNENDSYDEHVLELLAREVLWHFEMDEPVKRALNDIIQEFATSVKEADSKPEIIFRYPSFIGINMEALRTLVKHHACTPLLPAKKVTDLDVEADPWGIPGALPFGGVICSNDFAVTGDVWVNITPLCDLIKKKILAESLSLTFVKCRAHPVQEKLSKSDAIVVQGVAFDTRDFDLEVLPNRTLSRPVREIVELAKAAQWEVKARLRADVAKQIQQEVASHLSRRDALSSTGGNEIASRVCLRIDKKAFWYQDGSFGQSRDVVLSNTGSPKHHILDQEAFAVSTWAAGVLIKELGEDPYGKANFVSGLCGRLQLGVSKSDSHEPLQLKVDVRAVDAMESAANGVTLQGKKPLLILYRGE